MLAPQNGQISDIAQRAEFVRLAKLSVLDPYKHFLGWSWVRRKLAFTISKKKPVIQKFVLSATRTLESVS